ncbi:MULTISPECIES: ribosome maturation factor RimP [Limosilactobacillus]|uniref:ribosome maturation factor RimP n=1 Tax=Limosilactobacillus TaxID=2742598 RepID=UPI000A837D77|nr:ribosome maturation factor RimP [Limosilactobacillus pontis]MCX2185943.1 ribosome maturation factor RimP [Limosilactobacillus pontis]MCX2187684.1 ribosome maturation factor RimP [Limosilactobacillus pontis]QFV00851.1 ribosome maturation factor RimP [Limosilactobacillus pontis]
MSTVVETVTALVKPILDEHNFYLYDMEFVKEGKSWYLRVYIDKDGGITLNDCAAVSDQLSEALDNVEPDPIPQAYFLEVSSPGAERPLRNEEDYQRAVNDYIHVSLYQQINGKKVYEGTLTKLTDKELTLDYLDKTRHRQVVIDRSKVAQARLAIKF